MSLFDFELRYDSDWFVHLVSKEGVIELGIILQDSEIVPKAFQKPPTGFYITFVVDSVDEIFEKAIQEKFTVYKEPESTFYGQRRLLLKDPNGALIDVSSPIGTETS